MNVGRAGIRNLACFNLPDIIKQNTSCFFPTVILQQDQIDNQFILVNIFYLCVKDRMLLEISLLVFKQRKVSESFTKINNYLINTITTYFSFYLAFKFHNSLLQICCMWARNPFPHKTNLLQTTLIISGQKWEVTKHCKS